MAEENGCHIRFEKNHKRRSDEQRMLLDMDSRKLYYRDMSGIKKARQDMSEPITETQRKRHTFVIFLTTKLQINFESTKHRDEKNKLFSFYKHTRSYIRKNGRRIYPTHGKAFRIWVKDEL